MDIQKTEHWHLITACKSLAGFIDSWLPTSIRDGLGVAIAAALLIPGRSNANLSSYLFEKPDAMHAALVGTGLISLAMYWLGRRLNHRERISATEQAVHAQRMMAVEEKRKANNPFKGPK